MAGYCQGEAEGIEFAVMHVQRLTLCPERFPAEKKYPFNLDVLKKTKSLVFSSPVTFFLGENGSGKSTFLRAMARCCGLHIWGGFDQKWRSEEPLCEAMDVEWAGERTPGSFFSSQVFYNFARILDEWTESDTHMLDYFGGRSLVTLSHGQSLLAYFEARYRIPGLYLLDEPETALSPRSQLALLKILTRMSRAGHAQFIIVSHSPILLACAGAQLLSFNGPEVTVVEYEQTDYFRFYRDFLNHHRDYLNDMDGDSRV